MSVTSSPVLGYLFSDSPFAGLLFYFAGQCPAALPCKQVRLMRDHQPIGSTRNRTGTQGATLSTCHWWGAPKLWPPGMAPGSRGRNQMVIHPLISWYHLTTQKAVETVKLLFPNS